MADRFDVPFSTLGKRAVREKWQRSVPPNGNKDGNNTTVFPEIGNKIGNKHGNSDVLFPKNGNSYGNKAAVFPEIGNKIGNSEALFPSNNPLAAKNGSAGNDPAAKSGSKNGSSFHIPTDINEWDRLTAALFYLKQFHWAVHHPFQPTKGEDKEQGKRPPGARADTITRPPM